MIIYNITLKLDHEIEEAYINWLKNEHIPELMATGLFTGHRIAHLLEQDESEGATYIVQYELPTIAAYNTYISEHAQRMREKTFERFGNRFIAFRTLMETV